MTQEIINTLFLNDLGRQCNSLFSTPDNCVFIRYKEAIEHCIENRLDRDKIVEWFNENDY